MSLIIGLGSNLGNKEDNLELALKYLSKISPIISKSRIYKSVAVDYTDQPDFYNQAIELEIPKLEAGQTMDKLLEIEQIMGRVRNIDKGPRLVDIDILFWGTQTLNLENLIVPHPRWSQRSFVVKPLQELPFFKTLEKCFKMPTSFDVDAVPIK